MGTGKTYSTKYLLDSNNSSGVAGQVLSTTSTGIDWVDANTVPGTGLWLASGNDIYNSNSADVVIGGTSSNYKFGVTGGHIGVSNGGNIYIGGFGADAVIGYLGNTSGVFTLRSDGNRDISIGSGTVNNSVFIEGSNGNVGIGVTSPNSKLQIGFTGSLGAVTTNKEINVTYDGGYSTSNSIQYQVNAHVGTTFSSADIFTQTSGEVLKNFYVGIVSPNSYFNNNRYSIIQGGAERLTILGSISSGAGNVGIGTASPNSKLDIRRSGNGVALELHQTSGSANDFVDLKMIAGNTGAGTLGTILRHKRDGSGGGDFSILTNPTLTGTPTEKLIVKSGGNVGIGTTLPGAKLTVSGKVQVEANNERRYALQPSNWGYSTSYRTLILGSASTTYNTNDTGSVTLAFGVDVSANTSGSFTGNGSELLFRNGASFTTPNAANTGYHSQNLVLKDGNVGIGTTSPRNDSGFVTLQVGDTTTAASQIVLDDNDTNGPWRIISNQSLIINDDATERMRIDDVGVVNFPNTASGVGTGGSIAHYTNNYMYIKGGTGGLAIGDDGFDTNIYLNNSDSIQFQTSGTERMRIDSSGNVGIGTTNPNSKLEIEDTTSRLGTTASLIVEGRQDGAANVLTLRSKDFSAPTVGIGANHGPIMRWQGFDGTDFENMGYIFVGADGQAVANGDAPSYMAFGTSADGSSSPTERMRIDSAGSIKFNAYDSTNNTGTPTYLLGTDASGNVVKSNGAPGGTGYAPATTFSRAGINSSTYTMLATVNGNGLASVIQMSVNGTSGSVVINTLFDIAVNHYKDITVRSLSGDYTELTLRITSDDNEDFSIEAKHNGSSSTTVEVWIYPKNGETITPTTTDPGYTGQELEFTATEGTRLGGVDGDGASPNTTGQAVFEGPVGIGTTSPVSELHISKSKTGNVAISVQNTNASYSSQIRFLNSVGTERSAITFVPSDTSLRFFHNGADRMFINSSGNVGIGTTLPIGKLNVSKDSTIDGLSQAITVSSSSVSTKRMNLGYVPGSNYAFIDVINYAISNTNQALSLQPNGGNVGIGTTSPIAPLHVVTPAVGGVDLTNISRTANNLVRFTNPQYSTSATMGLLLRVFPDSDARQGAGLLMTGGSDNAASNLSLFVSKDDGTSSNISQSYSALHIAGNTGNVGIGTTNPGVKLDIDNGAVTDVRIRGNQTSDARIGAYNFYNTAASDVVAAISADRDGANDAAALAFDTQIAGGGMTERMRITSTGKVGIGISNPISKFQVVDTAFPQVRINEETNAGESGIRLRSFDGTNDYHADIVANSTGGAAGYLAFRSNHSNERMRITSTGNVGIGVTGPTTKLDVGGSVRIAAGSNLYFTSSNTTFKIQQDTTNSELDIYGGALVPAISIDNSSHLALPGYGLSGSGTPIKLLGLDSSSNVVTATSFNLILDDTPAASTTSGSGNIVNWSVSESVTAGTLYAVKTNGGWTIADADSEAKSTYMLAIALGSNATAGMLLQGFFYKSSHGFTIGAPLYVSNTAGAFSNSRPTGSGDYVRIIGYATSTNYIYFDPDKTWVKIA